MADSGRNSRGNFNEPTAGILDKTPRRIPVGTPERIPDGTLGAIVG